MKLLLEILGRKRPHGGSGERFVAEGILPRLPVTIEMFKTEAGDPRAYTCCTDITSKTLFVAHLDTVHREDGLNHVKFGKDLDIMYKTDGSPLGADDGAGVWLLYRMIEAGVPGTYLFTMGEECGGIGAKFMAEKHSNFLSQFDRAIAFDRKAYGSVITHQGWVDRCCSDTFAQAIVDEMKTTIPQAKLDDGGVYTDTAEFVYDIPECTNISVGYFNEHTGNEMLDLVYLNKLLEFCKTIKWEELPVERDLSERYIPGSYSEKYLRRRSVEMTVEDLQMMTYEEIAEFVFEYPDEATAIIIELMGGQDETILF